MEIKQLRALKAIEETGNFGEAAERLGLTQSALSHQIKHLEEELEETLLIRARPRVYPTPAGYEVLAATRKVLAEIEALEARFNQAKKGPVKGRLRIAATAMSIVYVLGDLCETFIERYPGIELSFTATETADAAARRVISGAADIAYGPLPLDQEQLESVQLGRTEHAFVVRAGHPLASQSEVTISQLREYPVVLFQPGSGTRQMTDQLFYADGGSYSRVLTETNDVQFLKRVVGISLGSALVPVYALRDEVSRGEVHLLRFQDRPLIAQVGLFHRRGLRMNAIELFKALWFDLRGPMPIDMVIENARSPLLPRQPQG